MIRRLLATLLLTCLAVAPALAAVPAAGIKLPPYERVVLANGLTLLLMEQHEVPLVSFNLLVRAGGATDPPGQAGLAALSVDLLRKGTPTRTADQVSAELDFLGATLATGGGDDYATVRAEFLSRHLDRGLVVLADIVLHPTFPQDQVENMISDNIDGIKSGKDDPRDVIDIYFGAFLYGAHPYGRPAGGDERSLAAIKRADVAAFYQAHYVPANAILAVAGDFRGADMRRRLEAAFGTWPARAAPPVDLPPPPAWTGHKLLLVDKSDAEQTYFALGSVGIARTDPDRPALNVVNTLFGGRFTSTLNAALRINSGLTYGANSWFDQRQQPGPFEISSYTRTETAEKALTMTLELLDRLHEHGPTDEQLQSARNYIKGQFPTDVETTDQLAALIARLEYFGLGPDDIEGYFARVDAVTPEVARRVIHEHFPRKDLAIVLIGKASEIRPLARKLAPQVVEKKITDPGY